MKFNLQEGEIKRILDLHKRAISKEQNNISEEVITQAQRDAQTADINKQQQDRELKIYKLKFPRSIKNAKGKSITLKKDTVLNFNKDKKGASFQYGSKWGWFSCNGIKFVFGKGKFKRIYTSSDPKFNNHMLNVCKNKGIEATPAKPEEIEQKVLDGSSGEETNTVVTNQNTFDYDTVMKAINDTGKCPKTDQPVVSNNTPTNTTVVQGQPMNQNQRSQFVEPNRITSQEDYILWTQD